MGYYYEQRPPEPDDEPRYGCLDVLLITRAVLGVLLWPLAVFLLVILDIAAAFYLFTVHPALVLIPVALTAAAIYAFARWDQNRDRPIDTRDL
jgi:hypothetical protein